MTLREKYYRVDKWHERVTLMELHHLRMKAQNPKYTLSQTAHYFGVSMGLVSENLRLALIFHTQPALLNCPNRQEALKQIKAPPNDSGTPEEIYPS
jgi:hypothetical protein